MITSFLKKLYGELENSIAVQKLFYTIDVGGGIKVATVIDPWGNAVGLIEEV